MIRHVKHIRHLILDVNTDLDIGSKRAGVKICTSSLSLRCHNLTSLNLRFSGHSTANTRASCEALILLNQQLRKLTITDRWQGQLCFSWNIVFSHCSLFLQTVDMRGCHLNKQEAAALMELGSRLRQLELDNCEAVWSDFTVEPQFPEMGVLTIEGRFSEPAQQLSWSDARLAFGNLQSQTWQCLQRIELAYTFSDSQVAQILGACGPLRFLSVKQAGFWYRSLAALERHTQTLEGLRLFDCDGLRSWMCQWIMVTFPKLTHLKLGRVFAHDMVTGPGAEEARANQLVQDAKDDMEKRQQEISDEKHDMVDELNNIMARFEASHDVKLARPWVCLNLVQLTIYFTFPREQETKDWDEQIFRQISTLDRLEKLNLGLSILMIEHCYTGRPLGLKVQSGLTHLAPLKKLTALKFVNSRQQLDTQDLIWILNQWPGMKEISSCLHDDEDIRNELWKMVEDRGIKLLLQEYEYQDDDYDDDDDRYSDFIDE
ncbi:hypothetical protein EMPS_02033 [Entomortierella parvispora]|uniref:Uncharacterized protein n=1 Tax=Entomortierella parvispora TaxID=205924 RepID=A0A9P3LTJ1_9FUNG|nr:hypothetical protein EMPS_02033 [Entomortierella parvispora]